MGVNDGWQEVQYKKNRPTKERLDLPSIQKMSNFVRYRSKEDELAKIAVSVFVTNFSDSCSAKDLYNACKQFGHVVDAFIPNKRSLAGDKKSNNDKERNKAEKINLAGKVNRGTNAQVFRTSQSSFAQVVTGKDQREGADKESSPVMVLDEECLVEKDVSKSLFGRVKEFASLANLNVAICNEGFEEINISYMGELWVKLDFKLVESIKKFKENLSIGSWFTCIKQASMDFVIEGRIAWVEIEGIPFKLWSSNTFKRIANRWGAYIDMDEQDDSCFHSKRICVHTKLGRSIMESFKIIHRGKGYWIRASESKGWVPDFTDEEEEEELEDNISNDGGIENEGSIIKDDISEGEEVPETLFEVVNETEMGGKNEQDGDSLKFPPGFTPKEEHVVKTMLDGEVQNNGKDNGDCLSQNHSTDPFGIYDLINKKRDCQSDGKIQPENSAPPGFSHKEDGRTKDDSPNDTEEIPEKNKEQEKKDSESHKEKCRKKTTSDNLGSCSSGHFKKSNGPRSGGSIIHWIEELVNVGQVMGYDMSGCLKNLEIIIESQGVMNGLRRIFYLSMFKASPKGQERLGQEDLCLE
ncbi:nucleotide-binding alpha-beta plait domain-containing protein [Tanacetum coccineum]|uniref:Nucleotide-binding alpha-beta plait domain-containing protein n=1 Tax=Tanacetum coccineum TaxID=301880 RepID=A0ABQ4Z230_9ASTR